jgi:hypothetical protein
MTHKELIIAPRVFHHHETHFFSLFVKTLPSDQIYLRGMLLNASKTIMKLSLRPILVYILVFQNCHVLETVSTSFITLKLILITPNSLGVVKSRCFLF